MPRTPKATDGETPKKRTSKITTAGDDSTKVTKATKAAKTANPNSVDVPSPVVETPAQPTHGNGSSPVKQKPLEERIRVRAYELYLRRGGVGGSPEQDWFQAMSEIYSESVA